jgi:hypothetical protein
MAVADTVPAIVAYLNQKFPGKGYGADYQRYAAKYPHSDPKELYAAFVLLDAAGLPGSLLKTEGTALQSAGSLDATAVKATSSLAPPSIGAGFLQFLDNLTSRALWVRVVKVILGVTMVLVGVGHLTGASSALTKTAKVAGLAAVA